MKTNLQLSASGSDQNYGGKIVVSGIGEREEDEFMLNLLNEQV